MDFGLWMSDFGLWIRTSDVGCRTSDVGLRISGVGLRISGVGLRMSTGYTGCGGRLPIRCRPPSEALHPRSIRTFRTSGQALGPARVGIWDVGFGFGGGGDRGIPGEHKKKLSYLTVGPLGTTPRGAEGAEAPPGSPLRRGRSSARRWAPVPGGAPAPSRRPAPRRPPASTAATAADRRRASERPSSSDSASPPAPPGCS